MPRAFHLRIGILFGLLLVFILPASGHGQENLLTHPREMVFPPLSFTPPKPARTILPNGIILYLLPDPEVPLIQVSALVRTGSIYDPAEKSGVARLTGTLLRTGGTGDLSPRAVNEALEFMAAEVEFSMSMEACSASLSVLKKDFPRALPIFAGLLMKPAFDSDQLDLAKKQEKEGIRRSNDHPEEIAYREFRKVLYGGNPRGVVPTLESIEKIQREDLVSFHRLFFHPNNLILGVSGDFQSKEMIASLKKAFGGWKRALLELPFVPLPTPGEKKMIYHAAKEIPQATILLGHLSLPLGHPDQIPLTVLNFICGGGGFNSRLTREIRSNQGLAYAVGSSYQPRAGYGVFSTFCQTKSSTAAKAISLIQEILAGIKKEKPSAAELEWAKDSLIHQFIFSFTSSASIVSQRMRLEYDGLPEDYLEKYQERVARVTLEDLARAAEEHLRPENSILLVVGQEKDFDQPLSTFGFVQRIELKKY